MFEASSGLIEFVTFGIGNSCNAPHLPKWARDSGALHYRCITLKRGPRLHANVAVTSSC